VATQSFVNVAYGPEGLEMMAGGRSAVETLHALTAADEQRERRQAGIIDREGKAASFTGDGCYHWAGHVVGDGYACQGNLLVPGTVEAMAAEFERARKRASELADWLVESLAAGQEAGGDKRGRQAAAVLVVRENGGYGGITDRYLDLRVDDDPHPIRRLSSLVRLHHLHFGAVDRDNLIPLEEIAGELQQMMKRAGFYQGAVSGVFDGPTRKALRALVGSENLEERWSGTGEQIDLVVVDYLRQRYG
jgi:uncharacterized Ntn-hydrolase superfamily protein